MTTVRPLLKYGWLKIASCGPQTYSSTSAPPPNLELRFPVTSQSDTGTFKYKNFYST